MAPLSAVLIAGLLCTAVAGPAAAADSRLLGRWRTAAQGGVVEIHACGSALCGRLVDAAPLRRNPDQRDVRNHDPALRDRPTTWTGGPLYDPDSGRRAASGRLVLIDPDHLAVRGCIAPLLCRTQTWVRLP